MNTDSQKPVLISPSLLSADFARFGEEVSDITAAGADSIHVDVMDGHFVPVITFGHHVVQAIRPYTSLPINVHLMISPVDAHIAAFAKAGATSLTVHPEASVHLHRTLMMIRDHGLEAGVALNPATPWEVVRPILADVDRILIMTVNPGFGGQSFLPGPLHKIRALRTLIDARKLPVVLEVDGGINPQTAPLVIEAGCDILVAGTAVFSHNRDMYAAVIRQLRGK